MNLIEINQRTESLFHDRAALVIKDILEQVGFNQEKLADIHNVVNVLSIMPAIGPIGKIQKVLNDMQPILLMAKENEDPGYYLKMIPEEKILYFINQVITRLEWVKNGNEAAESETIQSEGRHSGE